jgi:hypothetical protein
MTAIDIKQLGSLLKTKNNLEQKYKPFKLLLQIRLLDLGDDPAFAFLFRWRVPGQPGLMQGQHVLAAHELAALHDENGAIVTGILEKIARDFIQPPEVSDDAQRRMIADALKGIAAAKHFTPNEPSPSCQS